MKKEFVWIEFESVFLPLAALKEMAEEKRLEFKKDLDKLLNFYPGYRLAYVQSKGVRDIVIEDENVYGRYFLVVLEKAA